MLARGTKGAPSKGKCLAHADFPKDPTRSVHGHAPPSDNDALRDSPFFAVPRPERVCVILARRRPRIGFGFAGDPELERRVRVHANFAEYTPFALLLLALAEADGAPHLWLHASGALLLFGRLGHALGVSRRGTDEIGRVVGMAGSQTAILIAALLLFPSLI